MSSSDSDENDSNLTNLKEAIAPELLSCMSSHNSKSNSQSQLNSVSSDSLKDNKESLRTKHFRPNHKITDQSYLKTTPEFRRHLSKKLSSYLNGIVEFNNTRAEEICDSTTNSGIKLLRSSKGFASDDLIVKKRPTVKRKTNSESDSDDDEKYSQVAVSGTDILKGGEGAFANSKYSSSDRKRNFLSTTVPAKKSKYG